MALNRSDTILKHIVEYFIKNAQPVGSHTLIEEYKLPYSSATIRNEMFALEKMGLIEKTHSSSGRVPSAQGYRYYCEKLRDGSVNEQLKNSIQTVLDQKVKSIDAVIKESCEILSHMTNLVTVVMGPDENKEKLASIQMVQISDNTITAIFVTDKGYVENKTFIVPENLKAGEIVNCVSLLNDRLKGTPIVELVEKTEALKPVLNDYIVGHDLVYQALLETFMCSKRFLMTRSCSFTLSSSLPLASLRLISWNTSACESPPFYMVCLVLAFCLHHTTTFPSACQ